jgi:transposase
MSASPIVALLARSSAEELQGLRAKMRSELDKLAETRQRLEMELAQVEEAISKQSRQRGSKNAAKRRVASSASKPTQTGPTTRELVAALLKERGTAFSPSAIHAELREEGFAGSPTAVYNALVKLQAADIIAKVGEGLYEFASPTGAGGGAETGPSENGHHEPLSMAAFAQEGG